METTLQLIIQGGALGLLAYLIWWGTRTGWPQLHASLTGIQLAIERNTGQLKMFDEHQILQTQVLLRLVERGPDDDGLKEEAARLRRELERAREQD